MFIYRLEKVLNAIGEDVDGLLAERKRVRMRSGGEIELLSRERERERERKKEKTPQPREAPCQQKAAFFHPDVAGSLWAQLLAGRPAA